MRWCPGIGAGTKKLATARKKLRWCPGIGERTEKPDHGWTKKAVCARRPGHKALFTCQRRSSYHPIKERLCFRSRSEGSGENCNARRPQDQFARSASSS
ncbi:MAG: hypothetical protein QM296_01330 [Bacillota bacterium]|nr:hypothetical protein [Bacillota bacterium]